MSFDKKNQKVLLTSIHTITVPVLELEKLVYLYITNSKDGIQQYME